jgi:hypothetical protein
MQFDGKMLLCTDKMTVWQQRNAMMVVRRTVPGSLSSMREQWNWTTSCWIHRGSKPVTADCHDQAKPSRSVASSLIAVSPCNSNPLLYGPV